MLATVECENMIYIKGEYNKTYHVQKTIVFYNVFNGVLYGVLQLKCSDVLCTYQASFNGI